MFKTSPLGNSNKFENHCAGGLLMEREMDIGDENNLKRKIISCFLMALLWVLYVNKSIIRASTMNKVCASHCG